MNEMSENSSQDLHHMIGDVNKINCNAAPCLESLFRLPELWVFGYGSILWKPGFHHDSKMVGYVKGFTRKFWQGNTTHRGTPESPGRVATLVQQYKSRVWGVAYHVTGSELVKKALEHLGVRECSLGGYTYRFTHFVPRISDTSRPLRVLTFLATPNSGLYLGPAPVDELAQQIARCHGPSGTNAEYVIRLAQFIRANIPEDVDDHLFDLEREVLQRLEGEDLWKSCPKRVDLDALDEKSRSDCHSQRQSVSDVWKDSDVKCKTSSELSNNAIDVEISRTKEPMPASQNLENETLNSRNIAVELFISRSTDDRGCDVQRISDSVRKLSYDESVSFSLRYSGESLLEKKMSQPLESDEFSVRMINSRSGRNQSRRFSVVSISPLDSSSKEQKRSDGSYCRGDLHENLEVHNSMISKHHQQCARRHHSHMERFADSRNMYSG